MFRELMGMLKRKDRLKLILLILIGHPLLCLFIHRLFFYRSAFSWWFTLLVYSITVIPATIYGLLLQWEEEDYWGGRNLCLA